MGNHQSTKKNARKDNAHERVKTGCKFASDPKACFLCAGTYFALLMQSRYPAKGRCCLA